MSIKEELLTWNDACEAFDAEDYDRALSLFDQIADSAKIHFNIGTILATVQEHESAVTAFMDAVKADQYFAVSYFQMGASSFLLGDFEDATEAFNDALQYLRGNLLIDYKQLGLDYKLYSCEVLYNRGLCRMFMGEDGEGSEDLYAAQKEKQTPDHDVIDQAIEQGIDGLSVFSLPVGLLFRPPAAKVKNARKVDYLGSSKLIAAVEKTDMFTGFKGSYVRKMSNVTAADAGAVPASMLARSESVSRGVSPSGNRARRGTDPQLPSDFGGGSAIGRLRSDSVDRTREPMGIRSPQLIRGATTLSRRTSSASTSQSTLMTRQQRSGSDAGLDRRSSRGSSYSVGSTIGTTLRVKCHYNDVLMVSCDLNVTFPELVAKIQQKYNTNKPLKLKYKDEDDELLLMTDDDDLNLARSISERPDKLSVWCFD